MKFGIVLISCLIAFASASPRENVNTVQHREEIHLNYLEALIDLIKEELGYYDPIHEEDVTLIDFFGLYFKMQKMHVEGFSNILRNVTLDVDSSGVSFNFLLHLPHNFAYVEEWDSNIPIISGKGNANINVTNAELFVRIGYNFVAGLEPSVFKPSIEHGSAVLTGFNHDEELSLLSDLMTSFLNEVINSPQIHQMFQDMIDMVLGDILGQLTE